MAGSESSSSTEHQAPAGVALSEYHVGKRYSGSREALIAAGLATAAQFPGEPGCGKTSTVFNVDGRKVRVTRRGPRLFDVVIAWTPEERGAFELRQAERMQARRLEQEARASAVHVDKFNVGDQVSIDVLVGPRRTGTISRAREWIQWTQTTQKLMYQVRLDEPIGAFGPFVVEEEENLELIARAGASDAAKLDSAFLRFIAAALAPIPDVGQ